MMLIIGKAELIPDTFTHKYRMANSPYRIRLKYGSEVGHSMMNRKFL